MHLSFLSWLKIPLLEWVAPPHSQVDSDWVGTVLASQRCVGISFFFISSGCSWEFCQSILLFDISTTTIPSPWPIALETLEYWSGSSASSSMKKFWETSILYPTISPTGSLDREKRWALQVLWDEVHCQFLEFLTWRDRRPLRLPREGNSRNHCSDWWGWNPCRRIRTFWPYRRDTCGFRVWWGPSVPWTPALQLEG